MEEGIEYIPLQIAELSKEKGEEAMNLNLIDETDIVKKLTTNLPPLGLFKLELQFFGSSTNKSQIALSHENTVLTPTNQIVCFQTLIKINNKQLTLTEELGMTGKEREKCLIKECQENNISPSPLCQGHSADALKHLEKNQEKSVRTKKWVKKQQKTSTTDYYQEEINCYLKVLYQVSKEVGKLKKEINQNFRQKREVCQETYTEFFHTGNSRGDLFYRATYQKQNFYPPDYQEKLQQFWEKTEFLTAIKNQLSWLNFHYSQLQKELQQNQIETTTFNIKNQHK